MKYRQNGFHMDDTLFYFLLFIIDILVIIINVTIFHWNKRRECDYICIQVVECLRKFRILAVLLGIFN